MTKYSKIITAGVIGMLAALVTGTGEFLLHYDPASRFSEFEFMRGIPANQTTAGHFLGVLGAPLYLIGCWHIYQMMRSPMHHERPSDRTGATNKWATISCLVLAYGFVVGTVWIGSRSGISALINSDTVAGNSDLIRLYVLRNEPLLQIIRIAVLLFSLIFIIMTITDRTDYPRWMAAFNPVLLILASFATYQFTPEFGKYLMPVALNVAFFVFFIVSTLLSTRKGH